MAGPALAICVGATKAGTSWLHRVLSDHPETHFRAVKELHYFDALEWGEMDRQAAHMRRFRDWLISEMPAAETAGNARRLANLRRQVPHAEELIALYEGGGRDDAAYLAYLLNGAGDAKLVGDLTPSYSLLPPERLRHLAGIAPDVRVIYAMRDPVDRLWSHVRMMAARRAQDDSEIPGRASNILSRTFRGKEAEIEKRSDYAGALARLRDAVPEARFCAIFAEEMFTDDGLGRVCNFLGIGAIPAPTSRKIHAGPQIAPSGEQIAAMREWLAAQYDDVSRLMGRLPAAWTRHSTLPGGRDHLARA